MVVNILTLDENSCVMQSTRVVGPNPVLRGVNEHQEFIRTKRNLGLKSGRQRLTQEQQAPLAQISETGRALSWYQAPLKCCWRLHSILACRPSLPACPARPHLMTPSLPGQHPTLSLCQVNTCYWE